MGESPKPLSGIIVIDMTRVLAGPFATMILGQLGATIIKVESPQGDDSRYFGPFLKMKDRSQKGLSAYFTSLNSGKKSIIIDLKTKLGKKKLASLICKADILIENFRPGTLKKLGFTSKKLTELNKTLIYLAISGFGATGPNAHRPAYDMIIQALSGLMSITGPDAEGKKRKPFPEFVRVGTSISDIVSGLYATISIVTSLYQRTKTKVGNQTDLSMLDCTITILENAIARYQIEEIVPKPLGARHPSITPFESFQTKDSMIIIAAGNNSLFKNLCAVLGCNDLVSDPRFKNNEARTKNSKHLKIILQRLLSKKKSSVWLKKLVKAGVPTAKINTIADLFNDDQIKARKMLIPVEGTNNFFIPGSPLTPGNQEIKLPAAPYLGEHTDEIIEKLGTCVERNTTTIDIIK